MRDMRGTRFTGVVRAVSGAAMAAVMLWSATSCFLSGTDEKPTGSPSATVAATNPLNTLIHQAAESTKSLTSVHLLLETTGKIDGLGRISAANLDITIKPLHAVGKVTYDGQLDVPFRLADDSVSVNLFDEWTNIGSVSDLFPPGLIDPSVGVTRILESVSDAQSQGTETINGIAATKISGKVPVDAAKIMLPSADGPKNITVWIQPDGNHEVVRSLVEVSPGNTVQNTLSKWNVPVAQPAN